MAKEEISSLIKHVVTIFSFAMSTLALILSIAIGVQHQSAIQHINTELRNLGNRINQLSENIIAMQRKLILKSEALEINLGAQIGNLSEHYIDVSKDVGDGQKSLVQLQNKINVLRSTLDVTITNGIANLSQQQNATDINLLTALSQINGLKDDVMNITQRINTSVRIYDNCKEEQVSCEIKSERDRFWRVCSTPDMPLSIEGYRTVDAKCHYTSIYRGNHVATSMYNNPGTNHKRCRCSITRPDVWNPNNIALPVSLTATCYLTMLRCPTIQQLY